MRAIVEVRLKEGVLDPQGKAIESALSSLGFAGVGSVRQGKLIEIELDESDPDAARAAARRMADQLLANPVIETYSVELDGE
jgi:phosphoribosylformylglycinamidine synthase